MAEVHLSSPPTTLSGFPDLTVARNRNLWRVTRKPRWPWWFNSDKTGRFDLKAPMGTCYTAFDPMGALIEVLGATHANRVIPQSFFSVREICRLKPPTTLSAADVTSRSAFGFGITGEIGTVVPHALPQEWAAVFHRAGYDAVRYHLRHPPNPMEALAIFGPAGEQRTYTVAERRRISNHKISALRSDFGVEVLPVPTSREIRLI